MPNLLKLHLWRKKKNKVLPTSFTGVHNDEILLEKFQNFLTEFGSLNYLKLHATLREFSRSFFPAPEDREEAAQQIIKDLFGDKYRDKISISPGTLAELKSATKLDDLLKSIFSLRAEVENVLEAYWLDFVKKTKIKFVKKIRKIFLGPRIM